MALADILRDLSREGQPIPGLRDTQPSTDLEPTDFAEERGTRGSAPLGFLGKLALASGGMSPFHAQGRGGVGLIGALLAGFANYKANNQLRAYQENEHVNTAGDRSAFLRNQLNRSLSEANRLHRARLAEDRRKAAAKPTHAAERMVPLTDEDAATLGVAQVPASQYRYLLAEARQRRQAAAGTPARRRTGGGETVPVTAADGTVVHVTPSSTTGQAVVRYGSAWRDSLDARTARGTRAADPAKTAAGRVRDSNTIRKEALRLLGSAATDADLAVIDARADFNSLESDPEVRAAVKRATARVKRRRR